MEWLRKKRISFSTAETRDGLLSTYFFSPVSYTHLDVYKRQVIIEINNVCQKLVQQIEKKHLITEGLIIKKVTERTVAMYDAMENFDIYITFNLPPSTFFSQKI